MFSLYAIRFQAVVKHKTDTIKNTINLHFFLSISICVIYNTAGLKEEKTANFHFQSKKKSSL